MRIGGAKGVLMVDTSLRGRKICLRGSQIKFESRDAIKFNVIRTSKFNHGYLSR